MFSVLFCMVAGWTVARQNFPSVSIISWFFCNKLNFSLAHIGAVFYRIKSYMCSRHEYMCSRHEYISAVLEMLSSNDQSINQSYVFVEL